MDKPCDNCTVNIEEAILYDEVMCYLSCKDFRLWRAEEEGKVVRLVDQTKEG